MKRIIAIVLVGAMALALAACGSSSSDTSVSEAVVETETVDTAEEGGDGADDYYEVSMGFVDTNYFVTGFDICMSNSMCVCESGVTSLIYDAPFYFTQDGSIGSTIFEDWYWQDDTHLYCKLYDDIYFSNGDQLTGEDIKYTYQSILDGSYPITFMMEFMDTENWEVSDDGLELIMTMNEPAPGGFWLITYGILDKDYVESVGGENIDWYDPNQVVGSGPYVCTEYVQDSYAVFEKRDDYWGNAYGFEPTIDKFTITMYNDNTTMMADFASGVIDLAWGLNYDDYDSAVAGEYGDVQTDIVTNNGVSWLIMDDDFGQTQDVNVREAICYAVDADAIADVCYGSMAVYGTGYWPESMFCYTDDFQREYDPDKARQILADAGYSDGDVNLIYSYQSDNLVQTTVAEMVQNYLADVGINVELNGLDQATYSTEETVDGFSNIVFFYMSTYNIDPSGSLNHWMSDSTASVINRHGLYDEVIQNSNSTTDEDVRYEYLYELQQMWYDNADMLPLFEYPLAYMYKTEDLPEGYYIPVLSGNLFVGQIDN